MKTIVYKRYNQRCCCLETSVLDISAEGKTRDRVRVINDDLVACINRWHTSGNYTEIYSLSQQRCIGKIVGDPPTDIKVLKWNPNILVVTQYCMMTFWNLLPELLMVSRVQFDCFLQSNICEMNDGTVAVAQCELFLVSPQSMMEQDRFLVHNDAVMHLTGIRINVVVLSASSSTVRVVNFQQRRCIFELNHCQRACNVTKYAEGMFLVTTMNYNIQGWNDNGECWFHLITNIYNSNSR